jgi:hypothetical protein
VTGGVVTPSSNMRFLVVPGVLSEVEVKFHAAVLHGV